MYTNTVNHEQKCKKGQGHGAMYSSQDDSQTVYHRGYV